VSAGYSGTPLAKKLGIAAGAMVVVLDRADGRGRQLPEELAPMLDATVRIRTDLRARGPYDVVIVFVRSEAELIRRFEQARAQLAQVGGLWVAWPKQSSPFATKLRESHVRRGLVWPALRRAPPGSHGLTSRGPSPHCQISQMTGLT